MSFLSRKTFDLPGQPVRDRLSQPAPPDSCAAGESTPIAPIAANEAAHPRPGASLTNSLPENTSATALEPGDPERIGGYELLGRLGAGGMGTVYLARGPKNKRVALKIIHPDLAEDESFILRFRREVESARRVAGFCTARVIDAGLDVPQPYLATEYVEGLRLDEAIEQDGPLQGSNLDGLAVGVAAALTAIHGANVVHRDLKPSNVLLSYFGPRVIDFGIARALDGRMDVTRTNMVMGTPGWMAPEQLTGKKARPATDIFVWGTLVVFAATGRQPFGTGSPTTVAYRILNEQPELEGFDGPLRDVVDLAMQKDPSRRPTAKELLMKLLGESEDGASTEDTVTRMLKQGGMAGAAEPTPPLPGSPVNPSTGQTWAPANDSERLSLSADAPSGPPASTSEESERDGRRSGEQAGLEGRDHRPQETPSDPSSAQPWGQPWGQQPGQQHAAQQHPQHPQQPGQHAAQQQWNQQHGQHAPQAWGQQQPGQQHAAQQQWGQQPGQHAPQAWGQQHAAQQQWNQQPGQHAPQQHWGQQPGQHAPQGWGQQQPGQQHANQRWGQQPGWAEQKRQGSRRRSALTALVIAGPLALVGLVPLIAGANGIAGAVMLIAFLILGAGFLSLPNSRSQFARMITMRLLAGLAVLIVLSGLFTLFPGEGAGVSARAFARVATGGFFVLLVAFLMHPREE